MSMFLCFHVRNYIKTHVCLYFLIECLLLPLPPMDKGPLAKVNPVCSPLEEFCNQYAGGMMMHIQEQKV